MAKHIAIKIVARTRFVSADQSQQLTIALSEGRKGGFNLSASVKDTAEGADKATVGARSRHDDKASAMKRYEARVAEAVKAGWTVKTGSVKNAFDAIPAPKANAPRLNKAKRAAKPATVDTTATPAQPTA